MRKTILLSCLISGLLSSTQSFSQSLGFGLFAGSSSPKYLFEDSPFQKEQNGDLYFRRDLNTQTALAIGGELSFLTKEERFGMGLSFRYANTSGHLDYEERDTEHSDLFIYAGGVDFGTQISSDLGESFNFNLITSSIQLQFQYFLPLSEKFSAYSFAGVLLPFNRLQATDGYSYNVTCNADTTLCEANLLDLTNADPYHEVENPLTISAGLGVKWIMGKGYFFLRTEGNFPTGKVDRPSTNHILYTRNTAQIILGYSLTLWRGSGNL